MTPPDLTTALAELADAFATMLSRERGRDVLGDHGDLQQMAEALASSLRAGRASEGATPCDPCTLRCEPGTCEKPVHRDLPVSRPSTSYRASVPTPPPAGARDEDVRAVRDVVLSAVDEPIDRDLALAALDRIERRLTGAA